MSELVVFQPILHLIIGNNFLFKGVGACFWRFNCLNYFGECFALSGFEGRHYFLCHGLLNFFVKRYFFKDWVVFLQLHPLGGILPVFGCDVTGSTWHATGLMLSAFHNHLNPISFLCHVL